MQFFLHILWEVARMFHNDTATWSYLISPLCHFFCESWIPIILSTMTPNIISIRLSICQHPDILTAFTWHWLAPCKRWRRRSCPVFAVPLAGYGFRYRSTDSVPVATVQLVPVLFLFHRCGQLFSSVVMLHGILQIPRKVARRCLCASDMSKLKSSFSFC